LALWDERLALPEQTVQAVMRKAGSKPSSQVDELMHDRLRRHGRYRAGEWWRIEHVNDNRHGAKLDDRIGLVSRARRAANLVSGSAQQWCQSASDCSARSRQKHFQGLRSI